MMMMELRRRTKAKTLFLIKEKDDSLFVSFAFLLFVASFSFYFQIGLCGSSSSVQEKDHLTSLLLNSSSSSSVASSSNAFVDADEEQQLLLVQENPEAEGKRRIRTHEEHEKKRVKLESEVVEEGDDDDDDDESKRRSSTIYFNNPHLLREEKPKEWGEGERRDDDELISRNGVLTRGDRRMLHRLHDHRDQEDDSSSSGTMVDREGIGGGGGTTTLGGVHLRDEAAMIASHLRNICNDQLRVTSMQAVFDNLPFVSHSAPWKKDPEEEKEEEDDDARQMANRIRLKLKKYSEVVQRTKRRFEQVLTDVDGCGEREKSLCCNDGGDSRITSSFMINSEHFGRKVLYSMACDFVPATLSKESSSSCLGRNSTSVFEENAKEYPALKWQYFITNDNSYTRYPAHDVDPIDGCKDPDEYRMREIYLSTAHPRPKHIVILIDHGNSLSKNQLSIAKAIGKTLLSSLSPYDLVGLVGLSGTPSYPRYESCLSTRMVRATLETKLHFTRFIDGLVKAKDAANHSLGFAKAFELIRNTLALGNQSYETDLMLIVYISRGLLSYLTEARTIMETIAEENERLNDRVVINTFAVIDDGRPLMYEKNVLQDVADQNYSKYITGQLSRKTKKGMMVAVNTTQNMGSIVGNPFQVLNLSVSKQIIYSLPHWDAVGKGLVLSISVACVRNSLLVGVVGLDAHLMDVAEDLISYVGVVSGGSYAFLVDVRGYVVVHPTFTRVGGATEQPVHTHIVQLENRRGFDQVWDKMHRLNSGKDVLESSVGNRSKVIHYVSYSWKRVDETPYIVCTVTEKANEEGRVLKTNEVATPSDVVYHRLDMLQELKKCRHMKQLATSKAAALFLSSSCFHSPFEFLSQVETRRNVQGYMAYMSDNTKLIANPGLKSNVRSDVAALVNIVSEWKRQFFDGSIGQYIARRYVATPRGVFQVYPGTMLDKRYDPTKRPWYTRALEYPGQVVLTAPYLDVGGAGYIVSVSHTIYEGKSAAMHGSSDAVVAVMGLDFTLGYFYKLLLESMPVCAYDRIACFIMDDMGYLIAHPGLIEPNGKGPVEQQHITHKEPLVANDVLNHKGFVRKKLCNSFSDRTVQRFYKFNTSLDVTLTNLVHGEHCSKYHIVAIKGTNTFLGIVNQTCDMVTAFCPCSMVDRLCLNCHRMEQSECECPCECPLDVDLCTGELPTDQQFYPSCLHSPDEVFSLGIETLLLESLPFCTDTKCPQRTAESDCFGVLGCEWCQLEMDGKTPLVHPFCTEQRRCFGGVLGARTPYADEVVGLQSEEYLDMKNTPVGPVAGGIMGCFLVLALAVYCYRHHVHRSHVHHHYVSSVPDNQMRMSQLDDTDDQENSEEAKTVGQSNMVMASFENALNMSPYRISTGYRRPPGGDSDHGYSTMTPHEDSEHMPYVEPLLLGRDKCRPAPPRSVTSGSRTSSPGPRPMSPPPLHFASHLNSLMKQQQQPSTFCPDLSQTLIPESLGPNHVLASVQVHVVDTH